MIQWFPGHMAKALREMEEKVKLVDLIIILLDARIPFSSLNPELKSLFNNKKILYVFTKTDKADNEITNKWISYYTHTNANVVSVDARNKIAKKVIEKMALEIMKDKIAKDASRGIKMRPIRTMIVGIPNVGKSTLINTLCGKKVAQTGDKPGVTKAQQWTRISNTLELLDTPGVLWPKFDDQEIGYKLAITGAIKDDILPIDDVCMYFIDFLKKYYPSRLQNRYNVNEDNESFKILEDIAIYLNFYLGNKEVDTEKTSRYILTEYRNSYLGNLSLDR